MWYCWDFSSQLIDGLVEEFLLHADKFQRQRGPDAKGFLIGEKDESVKFQREIHNLKRPFQFGLAHQRLSIIDTSSRSNQPMLSADRRYALAYNGELYNYKELKKELEKNGCSFKTKSDTEVVLASLINWRMGALERFIGMYAFCFIDMKEHTVYLARDRIGIKPLHFTISNNAIVFASELHTIAQWKKLRAKD